MTSDLISIGNKVEIVESSAVRKGTAGDSSAPVLVSVIYEIIDTDHFRIEMPFRGTQIVLLELGMRYQISIYTSQGPFKCMVQVTNRFKMENCYIAEIEVKSALKRVQRREYFRLEKLFEIEYRRLTEEESDIPTTAEIIKGEGINTEYKSALAVDLSGGGARLVMNEEFNKDDLIMVHFNITPDEENISFVGTVVASAQMKMDTTQYENRIKFIKVLERQREKLIRYIFEEERKMRYRGKS